MTASYRWVVVGAGALITCVAIGAIFSLAVFLQPISEATGWTRAGISSAMTFDFLAMAVAGVGWGMASDRIGARTVVLCGAVLLGLGLVLASRAQTLFEFQLAYGVLVGAASGAFFAPTLATVANWFDEHRGLAVSLASAGVGVAPMTISPLARWLVTVSDWRTAMLAIGMLAWVLLIPAALFVRRPPGLAAAASPAAAPGGGASASAGRPSILTALATPQFAVLAVTYFCCCATHSGPIFHTISYAMSCGIAPMVAVSIYSVEGLAGLGGRILLGSVADRLGAKRVLIAGLLVQALAVGSYVYISRPGEFYVLAVILGASYGGVMPLYALLVREYFDPRLIGSVLGAANFASGLGMALGPLGGGWVFDTTHAYTWLYAGSAAIGLAAAAVAFAFPPVRRGPPLAPAAA
jgi:MFS family permease